MTYKQDGFGPVNPDGNFGSFHSDTLALPSGQTLDCVAIESREPFLPHLPADWRERVDATIERSDLVVSEYFPPELQHTVYSLPMLGASAIRYAAQHLQVYDFIAERAAAHDTAVAVMDPANKLTYKLYEVFPVNAVLKAVSAARGKGVASRQPDMIEKFVPTSTDARRMITAAGILQEGARRPSNDKLGYFAAPAHMDRIRRNLTSPLTRLDKARYAGYQKATPGLDKSVRTYRHSAEDGWRLVSRIPIV